MNTDTLALITNLWVIASFVSDSEDTKIKCLVMSSFWLAVLCIEVVLG